MPALGGGPLPESAGYHHIAFACEDVFAAAMQMRSARLPTLSVPGNYYDDLAARTDLHPATIDTMRELAILYDADDQGGVYFHFFTAMFGRRMFFEMVQRGGGYDGYGTPNTAGAHGGAVPPAGPGRRHWLRYVGRMLGGIGPLIRRPCCVSSQAWARMPTLRLSTNSPRASGAGEAQLGVDDRGGAVDVHRHRRRGEQRPRPPGPRPGAGPRPRRPRPPASTRRQQRVAAGVDRVEPVPEARDVRRPGPPLGQHLARPRAAHRRRRGRRSR